LSAATGKARRGGETGIQDLTRVYGQALSDAPWEKRIDTSRDLGDGIDPDLLPPEQFLE
jgi:hypothetical protein